MFIPFRLYTRWTRLGKIFADDCMVILAWFFVVAMACITTVYQVPMDRITRGTTKTLPDDLLGFLKSFERSLLAFTMASHACLWSVKLSFLLFLRQLTAPIRNLRIFWWTVLTFTVLSWATCTAVLPFRCINVHFDQKNGKRCQHPVTAVIVALGVECGLDILTDILSMSL